MAAWRLATTRSTTHTQNQRKESDPQNKGYNIEVILVALRGLLLTTNKTTPLSHTA